MTQPDAWERRERRDAYNAGRLEYGSGLLHLADDSVDGVDPPLNNARDIRRTIHIHGGSYSAISSQQDATMAAQESAFLKKVQKTIPNSGLVKKRREIKDPERILDYLVGGLGLTKINPKGVFGHVASTAAYRGPH